MGGSLTFENSNRKGTIVAIELKAFSRIKKPEVSKPLDKNLKLESIHLSSHSLSSVSKDDDTGKNGKKSILSPPRVTKQITINDFGYSALRKSF